MEIGITIIITTIITEGEEVLHMLTPVVETDLAVAQVTTMEMVAEEPILIQQVRHQETTISTVTQDLLQVPEIIPIPQQDLTRTPLILRHNRQETIAIPSQLLRYVHTLQAPVAPDHLVVEATEVEVVVAVAEDHQVAAVEDVKKIKT